uniref:Reverse transcriptase domain-containing protein n=1 Tax=Amphimedon queenslandica TaxID=400682 RepID=A0A1X7TDQ4_AMPQE
KSNSPVLHPSYFPEKSLCSISISLQDVFEVLTQLVASKAMGDCSALQKDLISLSEWCVSSKLSFNASKCSLIRFSTNSTPFENDYLLCGSQLKVTTSCRDLGIIVSDNLSWSGHYKFISSKAYSQLSLVKRCFRNAFTSVKKLIYISLVRSKITYCSQLWRPMLIKDILCIERIQRRATKYITNDYNKSTYKERLLSLNLLPLMYLYELNDVLFFIKCLKFPDPSFDIL